MNFKVEHYFPVFNMTWLTKKSQIISNLSTGIPIHSKCAFLERYLVVKQTFFSHSCGRNKELINERWTHPDEELNVGPMSERPTEDQCKWKVKETVSAPFAL